jgi:hypothetical protein
MPTVAFKDWVTHAAQMNSLNYLITCLESSAPAHFWSQINWDAKCKTWNLELIDSSTSQSNFAETSEVRGHGGLFTKASQWIGWLAVAIWGREPWGWQHFIWPKSILCDKGHDHAPWMMPLYVTMEGPHSCHIQHEMSRLEPQKIWILGYGNTGDGSFSHMDAKRGRYQTLMY